MAGYKTPDFNERTAAARAAKERALEQLRNKPAPDPEVLAAKQAAEEARIAAAVARREARAAAAEEAKAAKAEAARLAEEAAAAAAPKPLTLPTQAELKAARDARYAARKARKR